MPKSKQRKFASTRKALDTQSKGFNFSFLKLTDEMKKRQFRFKEAKIYRLCIVPYAATTLNPMVEEDGMLAYVFRYFIHRNVGPKEMQLVCNLHTYDEECYGCEELKTYFKKHGFNKELKKRNGEKQQDLFNVVDLDNKDEGICWFNTSHYMMFGQLLHEKLDADSEMPGGGMYQDFARLDAENGYDLAVKVVEGKNPENNTKFMKPTNIEFLRRKKDHPDEWYDQAVNLEELLWKRDYDEFKDLWTGGSGDEDEDEEAEEQEEENEEEQETPKSNGKSSKARFQESGGDDDTAEAYGIKLGTMVAYKFEDEDGDEKTAECEVIKVSGDGTSLTLQGEDGALFKGVAPSEVKKMKVKEEEEEDEHPDSEDEDDSEEEKPKARKAKGSRKDLWDDEEEDEKEESDVDEDEEVEDDNSEEEESEDEEDTAPPRPTKKRK